VRARQDEGEAEDDAGRDEASDPRDDQIQVRFRLGGGLGRDRLVLARPSFQRRSRLRTVNRLPAGVRA